MKKCLQILLAISMVFLAACSDKDIAAGGPASSQEQHQLTETETYAKGSIVIQYPRFTDQNKAVNKLIRTAALSILEQYEGSIDQLALPVRYEVKREGDPLISVTFSGMGYVLHAAHPNNHFYTVNVEPSGKKKIALKDIVVIDDAFVQKVRAAFQNLEPTIAEHFNNISDQDLKAALLTSDMGDFQTYSYYTADSLGLSFSAPHVLGDFVNIELKYSDIKDSFKSDSEIAGKLLNLNS